MVTSPPRWTPAELDTDSAHAIEAFRQHRMAEPLEDYLQNFDEVRATVENLLESTVDLTRLRDAPTELIVDGWQREVIRYLAGPPISDDDLKVVAQALFSRAAVDRDSTMADRVMDTVLLGLDRERFPWLAEQREPTESERQAAIVATAALIASQRVRTKRNSESKTGQEGALKTALIESGFTEVSPRDIETMDQAPAPGEFCGECKLGTRKADVIVRLWDSRVMPVECKTSNSSTNSVKRLNNDAAAKAERWLTEFGTRQTVPAALLAGVFKRHNLEQAQAAGLTLWWSHDLPRMLDWIESTR